MEETSFISKRMIEEVKTLLEEELKGDKKAIKIAKNIFERYTKGGAKAVREYLKRLVEEEENNANPEGNKGKRV